MSTTHARAARRERQTAAALGTSRVHRKRGERAPDVLPIHLRCGVDVQPEVKSRKRLPYLVTSALRQAEGYQPDAMPLAVIFESGTGDGLAIVRLRDFARVTGLDVAQLPKATPCRRRPAAPPSPQLSLVFAAPREGS